jgi:hypothetical protein
MGLKLVDNCKTRVLRGQKQQEVLVTEYYWSEMYGTCSIAGKCDVHRVQHFSRNIRSVKTIWKI